MIIIKVDTVSLLGNNKSYHTVAYFEIIQIYLETLLADRLHAKLKDICTKWFRSLASSINTPSTSDICFSIFILYIVWLYSVIKYYLSIDLILLSLMSSTWQLPMSINVGREFCVCSFTHFQSVSIKRSNYHVQYVVKMAHFV